jgi:hypothetical protein
MIFDEYQEVMQVWRQVASVSGTTDPVWTHIYDIGGRLEPVNYGSESILNNQNFADVSEYLFSPVTYETFITPNDGIVDPRGVQRQVIGWPEIWRNINPHMVIMLKRAAWDITN